VLENVGILKKVGDKITKKFTITEAGRDTAKRIRKMYCRIVGITQEDTDLSLLFFTE
jgi:predicted transcriptional regulator